MNYNEAIVYITGTLQYGSKLGLASVGKLLELMGNPQHDLKFIHVAGTNGKGSTSSFISRILTEAGYRAGLYTSPALEVFNERIRINGENIGNEPLGELVTYVKTYVDQMVADGWDHPTEFEIVTAMAFEHFKRQNSDFVVLEVGLGGRQDSTNIIDSPLVSVITPIDLDHTDFLGDTLTLVATEKAGIIKENSVCVIHPQVEEVEDVIIKRCTELNTRLVIAPVNMIEIVSSDEFGTVFHLNEHEYRINLIGDHQTRNAAVAITVINALRENHEIEVSEEAIMGGLLKTTWPGRLEIMGRRPTVIIDGAHNIHGAKGLAETICCHFNDRKIIAVVGILKDKDYKGILDEMMPLASEVIVTEPNSPRKLTAMELAEAVRVYGKAPMIEPSIKDAITRAMTIAGSEDVIIFFGSLYMIGEARTILKSIIF